MASTADYRIRRATWRGDRAALCAVRRAVFVIEQGVPEEMEWDEFDAVSLHVLAETAAGVPIGTARLLPDGHVGRMAVLKHSRGRGVGSALLQALVAAALSRGDATLQLHAQTHAIGFYERHGFGAQGGEFVEAGIPHRRMTLTLRGV